YKHVHEPPPLDELPSDLPQGVVAVVEKALAKDPADRYQSAGQMVEALRKAAAEVAPPPPPAVAVEERPVEAAPLRPEPEVAPPPLVEPVAVPEEEAVPFWRKVPLWGWALGGLILLMVGVCGIIALLTDGIGVEPSVAITPRPPTPTPTPTATLAPTYTYTPRPPTATPTPTVALWVLAGTPVPWPAAAISPENADRVAQLARWGQGTVNEVAYSPDGTL
ncbi:MAG: hypothetical protein GTN71_13035, partial [Anaerolineae bacterium]|nr:hypothetical protein [Anaerolineae bacterium]